MHTMDAIKQRASAGKMKTQPVDRQMIERLLEAGVQAPNHYKVRPWRFVVLLGGARDRLGEVMANVFHRRFPDLPPEALQKERNKPMRAPVVIAVGVDEPHEAKVLEIENICAAAAACENILLAAEDMGLGAKWRTGDTARNPEIKRFLGFSDEQLVIAFLYIGYPEEEPVPPARPGYHDRTIWME